MVESSSSNVSGTCFDRCDRRQRQIEEAIGIHDHFSISKWWPRRQCANSFRKDYRTQEICMSCVRVWSDWKISAAAIEVQLIKMTPSTRFLQRGLAYTDRWHRLTTLQRHIVSVCCTKLEGR